MFIFNIDLEYTRKSKWQKNGWLLLHVTNMFKSTDLYITTIIQYTQMFKVPLRKEMRRSHYNNNNILWSFFWKLMCLLLLLNFFSFFVCGVMLYKYLVSWTCLTNSSSQMNAFPMLERERKNWSQSFISFLL